LRVGQAGLVELDFVLYGFCAVHLNQAIFSSDGFRKLALHHTFFYVLKRTDFSKIAVTFASGRTSLRFDPSWRARDQLTSIVTP
jgi:hypothetical protein